MDYINSEDVKKYLKTEYGIEEVVRIDCYDRVISDMEENKVPKEEIDSFINRVRHFLGDENRYYEVVTRLVKPNDKYLHTLGDVESYDWSEVAHFESSNTIENLF